MTTHCVTCIIVLTERIVTCIIVLTERILCACACVTLGFSVVIAPDGSRVLTAAHVACLAGSRNRLRVRAPTAAGGGEWMTATVVGARVTGRM